MNDDDHFSIQLRLADGSCLEAEVTLDSETETTCSLSLLFDGRCLSASACDYFEAFCDVRRCLETDGILPVCYGASRTAYPSPMSRDMGGGLLTYRLELGRPGRQRDLVSIFSTGSDVVPATVAEQREFADRWLASLGGAT